MQVKSDLEKCPGWNSVFEWFQNVRFRKSPFFFFTLENNKQTSFKVFEDCSVRFEDSEEEEIRNLVSGNVASRNVVNLVRKKFIENFEVCSKDSSENKQQVFAFMDFGYFSEKSDGESQLRNIFVLFSYIPQNTKPVMKFLCASHVQGIKAFFSAPILLEICKLDDISFGNIEMMAKSIQSSF